MLSPSWASQLSLIHAETSAGGADSSHGVGRPASPSPPGCEPASGLGSAALDALALTAALVLTAALGAALAEAVLLLAEWGAPGLLDVAWLADVGAPGLAELAGVPMELTGPLAAVGVDPLGCCVGDALGVAL